MWQLRNRYSATPLIWLAIVSYILIVSVVCIWKYWHLGYNALDLAILNNTLWHSLQGNWLGSSIHPPSYVGDHFTPLLLGLLPIYALAPRPETLLIIQTIVLALCAWPIALITKKFFESYPASIQTKAAVIAVLLWLLNPFVHNINLFEFHATPFALPGLLFAFWFYQRKQFWPMVACMVVSLLAQEDVAIAASGLGLLALVDRRSPRWWLGVWLVCGSYFLLASNLITAVNPGGYKYLVYYSWLGDTPREIILTALLQPWRILARVLSPNAILFSTGLLLPFAFLPLIKPKYLLLLSGIAAQLMLGSSGGSSTLLGLHYTSLLLPGLTIATIAGASRWYEARPFGWRQLETLHRTPALFCLLTIVTVGYASIMLGPLAGLKNLLAPHPAHQVQSLLRQIPPNAAVAASYDTLANVSSRQNVFALNYGFLKKQQFLQRDYTLPVTTDYLLLDATDLIAYRLQYGANAFYTDQYAAAVQAWPDLLDQFSVVDQVGHHLLLIRDPNRGRPIISSAALPVAPPLHTFGTTATIRNASVAKGMLTITWQLGDAPPEEPALTIKIIAESKKPSVDILPLGYGMLPTSRWQAGKILQVRYALPAVANPTHAELYLVRPVTGGIDLTPTRSTRVTVDRAEPIGEPFTLPLQ